MPKSIEGLLVRRLAAERLDAVLKGANFLPFETSEIEDGRDRAFANRLVTTALRRHGHLNAIISALLTKGLPKKSGIFEAALRLGLTELLFLEGGADHSALFLAVELVKSDKRAAHLNKLVNGVLRQAQREAQRFGTLPVTQLLPEWIKARWERFYGDEAVVQFAHALLETPPLDVTLKGADAELIAALGAQEIHADSYRIGARSKPVAQLPGYDEGGFWVQDIASAIPARLFDLPPGARVLDLCAAPGGKTAQLIKAGYAVSAVDVSAERMARVKDNLERLQYSAQCTVADALAFTAEEKFDGVLVDAPCTATGTFRRHPEVLWQRQPKDIGSRVDLQKALVTHALTLVKPGGVLVYGTCSLEREEAEHIAQWLDEEVEGVTQTPVNFAQNAFLSGAVDGAGNVRLTPGLASFADIGRVDGFFAARFVTDSLN